jgi:hypothetical protein
MVNQFKFLQSNDVVITNQEPPFGISRRHWNLLPQDLRGSSPRHMEVYIEGWEACRNSIIVNPYMGINDTEIIEWRELWNRGYLASINRRRRVYTERDMEYYHTEEFLFFDVSEVRYNMVDGFPYKVMLFRSIEEGNTVEGQTIYPDHYMYNFPDVI